MDDEYFDDQTLSMQERQQKICSFLANQKAQYVADKSKQARELRRLKGKELIELKRGMVQLSSYKKKFQSSGETVHQGPFQVACKSNDYFISPTLLNQSYDFQKNQFNQVNSNQTSQNRLKSANTQTTSNPKKKVSYMFTDDENKKVRQNTSNQVRMISQTWIPNYKNPRIFNKETPIIEPDKQKYPPKTKTIKFVEQNIQNYVWNPNQKHSRPFSSTSLFNSQPKVPVIQENTRNILLLDKTDQQKIARQIYKGNLDGCIKFQKIKPFYPQNMIGQSFPEPKVVKANNQKYLKNDILINEFYDTNRG